MTNADPRQDALRGALAHVDGALALWPDARLRARLRGLGAPLRWGEESVAPDSILWAAIGAVLLGPGVLLWAYTGLGFAPAVLGWLAVALVGWAVIAWTQYGQFEDRQDSLFRAELQHSVEFMDALERLDGQRIWQGPDPTGLPLHLARPILERTQAHLTQLGGVDR